MNHQEDRCDAAVAETIGFIYIFAIVILSISVIYVMGYPALQSSIDESVFASTEQSFIVIQSYVKIVGFDQVPVKSLKIQLQGATLSITQNSNMTIYYDSVPVFNVSGEIEYQKNDMMLTYENGGVWERYASGSIMVSKPPIFVSSDGNFTTIGAVSVQGTSSTGGKGIALLSLAYNDSSVNKSLNRVNVTLNINSSYAPEWGDFLSSMGFDIIESQESSLIAMRNNTWAIAGKHLLNADIT